MTLEKYSALQTEEVLIVIFMGVFLACMATEITDRNRFYNTVDLGVMFNVEVKSQETTIDEIRMAMVLK